MLIRLALAAMLLLAGLAPAGAQTPLRALDLAREFEEISFPQKVFPPGIRGPKRQFRRAPQPLPKPLKISVFATADDPDAEVLEEILGGLAATLRKETDVRIQARPGRHHPFSVVGMRENGFESRAMSFGAADPSFFSAFAFAQRIKKEGCFFYSLLGDHGEIVGGNVLVDLDRPEVWQSCIYRGMIFILGLEGNTLAPTGVFTDVPKVRGFTPRDLAIVRMSLDPRLKPGMTLAEARPLLPAIAADALAR